MRSRCGSLQCSYSVCLKKLEDNKRAVEEFADRWRARGFSEMFQCYYDTIDPSRVIVEKMYSINDVIHSMTWPSLVVVFCGLIFLRLQTRRHKLTLCGRRGTSASQTAVNDVVKQPLRQHHQQREDNDEEQYSEDHHSDSYDRKDSSSQHSNPTTSYIRPTTSCAGDAACSDDVFNDDDMRCEEDTESHLTPQLCYTSSSSSAASSVAPIDDDGGLPLVLSASSPALNDDARQTESTTSRPLSTSRSAADLTT